MKRLLKVFLTMSVILTLTVSVFAQGASEASMDTMDKESPITLTIAAGAVGQELELCKDAAMEYMKMHPEIIVEVLETPDLTTDRLGLYLQYFESKSDVVDLYQIDVIWPGDIGEHLVDLYQYGGKEHAQDHFPSIIENNTVDGKLVAMPWFTDAGLLYFRTDLLEKYGYTKGPETWDELTEMAMVVQKGERKMNPDFWGFVWQGNSYEGLTCDAIEWINSNGGGSIVEPDGTISINNKKAEEAITRAAGWVGTISPDGVVGFGEEDARNMFQAGNALFMRNWPYAYSLGNSSDSIIKGKFGVSALPSGDSGHSAAALGGWQLACSKYSSHIKDATDLLFFMTDYEQQKQRAIVGSLNPTIEKLYSDPDVLEATPFFGSLYNVFVNTVARPSTATAPRYAEVSKVFFTNVHGVLTGDMMADRALKNIELDIEEIIK